MFKFFYFMPDGDGEAGGAMGGEAAVPDAPDTGSDDGEESGGTTAEEVAQILNLPQAPTEEEVEDDVPEPEDDGDLDADGAGDEPAPDEPTTEQPAPASTTEDDKSAETATDEAPDFSFTVEDADGVTFKVGPDDDIDSVLKDFNPTGTGQLVSILGMVQEAKQKQSQYESDQAAQRADEERDERVAKINESIDNELSTLVSDGRIPAANNLRESERGQQIFDFMRAENEKRSEDGRPLLASVEDALDKLENKERRESDAQAKVDRKETARKNGSLVGGSSAAASGGSKPYVSGSATNATQALRQAGLL
jgi:hypothetical protein